MADFCTKCAAVMGFDVDIDVEKIFKSLPPNNFQYALCEGCGLAAIANWCGEMRVIGCSFNSEPHEWMRYDAYWYKFQQVQKRTN